MKTKEHISPIKVFLSLIIIATLSVTYLTKLLLFKIEGVDALAIIGTIGGLALFILSIVLVILIKVSKKMNTGDEYTTGVIRDAGLVNFGIILILFLIMFIMLYMFMLFAPDSANTLNDLFDVRVILAAVAGIQLFATFFFILLVYIFNRTGENNELQ